jgi:hypothetical protein
MICLEILFNLFSYFPLCYKLKLFPFFVEFTIILFSMVETDKHLSWKEFNVIKIMRENAWIPCNLCTSFSLFSHLIKRSMICAFVEYLGLWRVKTVKCPLRMCPFKFTFFLSKIFLSCKSNLKKIRFYWLSHTSLYINYKLF